MRELVENIVALFSERSVLRMFISSDDWLTGSYVTSFVNM